MAGDFYAPRGRGDLSGFDAEGEQSVEAGELREADGTGVQECGERGLDERSVGRCGGVEAHEGCCRE